jgi:DNA (cytosine-5)-methyltransferase 1
MGELYIEYPDGSSLTFHRDDSITESRSNTCDSCSKRKSLQGGKYIAAAPIDGMQAEDVLWQCFECRLDEMVKRGREVLSDLTSIGYDARWKLIRASEVGAPHRRERLFILAHPVGSRCSRTKSSRVSTAESRFAGQDTDDKYTHTDGQRCYLGQNYGDEVEHQGQSQLIASGLVETIEAIPDTNNGRRLGSMQGLQKRYDPCSPMYLQEIPPPLDQGKLNVKFVEYMMGLPNGWVTDVEL